MCVCLCLIDALILSHSGNGPWVGLSNGTQIFTMDTNIFVSTSMPGHVKYDEELCSSVLQYSGIIARASLAGSSVSQLGSEPLRWLISVHEFLYDLSQPQELFVLMTTDEVKIRPHAPHPRPDAGQELKHSGPILCKSEMVAFTHHTLFLTFKCSEKADYFFPPMHYLCYLTQRVWLFLQSCITFPLCGMHPPVFFVHTWGRVCYAWLVWSMHPKKWVRVP